jgi:iron complex outermembrane receptor protein
LKNAANNDYEGGGLMKKRGGFLLSTIWPFALIGGQCWAQAQSLSLSTPPETGALPGSSSEELGEIVVTAQHRSENIQEVPISVTAISPNQIRDQGMVLMQDVQLVSPGLTFVVNSTFAAPYIRGIGTAIQEPGIESAVATYVDGAYVTRSFGTLTSLFDMSGVEVLNGAQGTLYGRNATGGVILYNTADPELNKESVNATAEYGDYDHAVGELVVNAPLGDTLALRVGAREYNQGGYVTNIVNGQENLGERSDQEARVKLKWQPTDTFSAVASFDYVRQNDFTDFYQERLPAPYCGSCALPIPGADLNPVSGFYDATNNPNSRPWKSFIATGNLHVNYSADKFDLNSVTSIEHDHTHGVADTGLASTFSLNDFDSGQGGRTIGEELQALSKLDGMFNGMLGFSFNHDHGIQQNTLVGLVFAPLTDVASRNDVLTTSNSGFAELYVTPVDRLKLTVGVRYTDDSRHLDVANSPEAGLAFAPTAPLAFPLSANFTATTGRAVVDYKFDTVNLYASWNRGFKAGGFNTPAFTSESPVNSETIDDYELGAKYVSDDRRLRASVATFFYRYSNIQVQNYEVTPDNPGGLILQNAGAAKGYGSEFNVDYSVVSWLNVFGTLSTLHARYLSYPKASDVVLTPGVGLVNGSENLAGTPLPQAPDATVSAGFDAHKPIGDDLTAHLNVSARYTSSYVFFAGGGGPQNFAFQPAYPLANISADIEKDLRNSGQRTFGLKSYKVGFFIYNATNRRYYILRDVSAGEGAYDVAAPPLTFGLRISAEM